MAAGSRCTAPILIRSNTVKCRWHCWRVIIRCSLSRPMPAYRSSLTSGPHESSYTPPVTRASLLDVWQTQHINGEGELQALYKLLDPASATNCLSWIFYSSIIPNISHWHWEHRQDNVLTGLYVCVLITSIKRVISTFLRFLQSEFKMMSYCI